jgi:hypothetical protein
MELPHPEGFALRMSIVIDGALSSGKALHVVEAASFLKSIARILIAAPQLPV